MKTKCGHDHRTRVFYLNAMKERNVFAGLEFHSKFIVGEVEGYFM